MATALIGYTGFVGSNLAAQHHFDDLYNSKNIADIEGKEYELVVSAANRADMWRINQEGAADLAEIDEFIEHIKKVRAKQFVLISTVGVYKSPNGADEDTPIDTDGLTPYGQNRYHLEEFVRGHFDNVLIVRLPGLFGPGLKKNVIFDLLHDNMVDKIHSEGQYQYYNLGNIWKDIETALKNNLPLVNLAISPRIALTCLTSTRNRKASNRRFGTCTASTPRFSVAAGRTCTASSRSWTTLGRSWLRSRGNNAIRSAKFCGIEYRVEPKSNGRHAAGVTETRRDRPGDCPDYGLGRSAECHRPAG